MRMLLENSISLEDFSGFVKRILKDKYIEIGENAIMVYVGCSDDQCTTVLEEIKREIREGNSKDDIIKNDEIYERRVFGGIFLPNFHTKESLIPAAHHIPDEKMKKLFVLHLSHIGYDNERGYGYFIRYHHKKHSTACGAIKNLFESNDIPRDIDLLYLKRFIEYVKDEGDNLENITLKLLKSSEEHMIKELFDLAKEENLDVVYIAGIEVDLSKKSGEYYNDGIYVDRVMNISKDGIRDLEVLKPIAGHSSMHP